MHYGRSTFAKEVNQVTILPKRDPRTELTPEIGQRDQLSVGDIRQTSKLYQCSGMEQYTASPCKTNDFSSHTLVAASSQKFWVYPTKKSPSIRQSSFPACDITELIAFGDYYT